MVAPHGVAQLGRRVDVGGEVRHIATTCDRSSHRLGTPAAHLADIAAHRVVTLLATLLVNHGLVLSLGEHWQYGRSLNTCQGYIRVDIEKCIEYSVLMDADTIAQCDNARDELLALGRLTEPQHHAGEWDWYWTLEAPERKRIATYWCGGTIAPDMAADWFGSMARWLELSRQADIPRVLRSPSMRDRDCPPALGGIAWTSLVSVEQFAPIDEVADLEDVPDESGRLVGLAEVAAMLGKPLTTVSSWYRRGRAPMPLASLKCGPVWTVADWQGWVPA